MTIKALAAVLFAGVVIVGCGDTDGDGETNTSGQVTVDASDTTPPSLTLGVAETNSNNTEGVSVTAGTGGAKTLRFQTRTEPVNIVASARDDESGVQKIEVWVTKRETSCQFDPALNDDICQDSGPLSGPPRYQSSEPKQPGGAGVSPSSILAASMLLKDEIGQGAIQPGHSFSVDFIITAKATNHAGVQVGTSTITATWSS